MKSELHSRGEKFALYRRLFAFARPYRGRLAIGVLAGLFSAGTFFGLLSFMPDAFDVFEVSDRQVGERKVAVVAPTTAEPSADDPARPPVRRTEEDIQEENEKLPGWFVRAEKAAERFGVELRNEDDSLTWQALLISLLGLPVVAFLRIISSFANRYFMRWVGAVVVRDIRNELFLKLQHQSLKFFGKIDIGQLISRCVNDTASVEHVIASTIADMAKAPFEIIAAVTFMVFYAIDNDLGRFLLTGGLLLPLCLVPVVILGQRVRRWTKKSLERISFVVSRMHENFTGIRVVKAFDTETYEQDRFEKTNATYFAAVVKTLKTEMLMSPLMESVATVLCCFFVAACFIFHIQLAQILIIGVAIYSAYRPLKQLAQINASLQRGAAAFERIITILDTDTSLPEAKNPVPKKTFEDKIVFDHVDFRFSPEGPEVVHDACFTVPRGSLVALVGETGSGKSTYANLLARFYDPVSGSVTLDGVDLRDISTTDLRRLIGVVTQDTILFNDTIANNIAYGTPDATREQIEQAAKMANAHDFIIGHPEGYDRVCGDKGFLLSGGEKQRVALARAILRNPPILILDEATSALDTVTERLVQDAIAKVMANRATLAIAHRLSTVRDASAILVIDKGRIVECGTHDELYARNGRYRQLCDMQLNG